MSRTTTYRSSDVAFNGKLLCCYAGGAVAINGTTEPIRWVAPCDGTIVMALIKITTVFTHATAALRIGSQATPDDLLNDYVLTSIAAGSYDLTKDTLMAASPAVTRGTAYTMGIVCGDTTGELDAVIVIEPT